MEARAEGNDRVVPAGTRRLVRLVLRLFPGRSLVDFEALVPDLATGLRAAAATVIPLSLAMQRGRPELTWMALGGWLGTLADPGGSRAARARPLAVFAVLGALEVALTEAGAGSVVAAAGLVALIAFLASMLRALGSSASRLGAMFSILAALAAGSSSREPVRDALWFAAGSSVAVVLSSIVWPVWTHLPVRRALANVFRELGAYARAIEQCLADGIPEDDPRWALAGRRHTRRGREAIDMARAMSLAIRARRSGESRLGSNLRVLLGMAESQFFWLISLATEVEASRSKPQAMEVRSSLASIAKKYDAMSTTLVLGALGDSLLAPQPGTTWQRPPAEPADPLRELTWDLERESEAARALAGSLDRSEVRSASIDAEPAAVDATLAIDWRLLRDALSPRSPLAHHAVRVAAAGAVSAVIGHFLSPRHAPWVTLTALVVLQPASGATVRRAAERVVGTIWGALMAVAIAALRPGPLELSAIMFPLSVGAIVTRPRSYRLFTLFLTPIFVLVAIRTPEDWWVAVERTGDTVAGGAVALAATLLLWPRWEERTGLPEALSEMTRATESYATLVLGSLERRDAGVLRRIAAARLSGAASVGRAEAALEGLLENPLRSGDAARAMELVTYARRLVLATTTLDTFAAKKIAGGIEGGRTRIERYRALIRRTAS